MSNGKNVKKMIKPEYRDKSAAEVIEEVNKKHEK